MSTYPQRIPPKDFGRYLGGIAIQGPQGARGTTGPQGPQGPQGLAGEYAGQGAQGPQGPQGQQGAQGASIVGPQGEQGQQGPQGTQGLQGSAGGPQGPQGLQGIQGDPGGPQGFQGATGAQGPQGTQGPQGHQGSAGPQGVQGATGSTGVQGAQGSQGHVGAQGFQGSSGPQGNTGSQGPTGLQGTQGSQGATGATGAQGSGFKATSATNLTLATGTKNLTTQGGLAYVAGSRVRIISSSDPGSYLEGNITSYVGTSMVVDADKFSGTPGGNFSSWSIVVAGETGAQGSTGAQGVQGTTGSQGPQGNDGVQGPPGTGAQGAQGDTGSQGPQGVEGPQGVQGATGLQGPQGAVGPQGNVGSTGAQGTQGAQGSTGSQGPQGSSGAQGLGGSGYDATSSTSLDITNGTKVLTIDLNKAYVPGSRVNIISTADANNQMGGEVTAYNAGTGAMDVTIDTTQGSGTFASWNISIGGTPGPQGVQGADGVNGAQGAQGDAGAQGAGYGGTSSTTETLDVGARSLTIETGLAYTVGNRVRAAYVSDPGGTYMEGVVTGYNPGTGAMAFTVDKAVGTVQAYANWSVGLTGDPGQDGSNGAQGPQGEAGAQGSQGPQGAVGPQGAEYKGTSSSSIVFGYGSKSLTTQTNLAWVTGSRIRLYADGVGDYMEGNVTSYTAGTGAMVVSIDYLSGTLGPSHSLWTLVLTGEIGPQGLQGDTGGPQGPQGVQGDTGPQGVQGNTGSQGPQGDVGTQGSQGTQGNQGPQGNTGAQGAQGPQGFQGSIGATGIGATGAQGPQGNTGSQGAQGTQGVQGVQGAQGPQGSTGPQGTQGVIGAGYQATSDSSHSVTTGTKIFDVNTDTLAYTAGAQVRISRQSDPVNTWMQGIVTGYSGGFLTVLVSTTNGSGTYEDWNINLQGNTGAQGSQGTQGTQGVQGPQGINSDFMGRGSFLGNSHVRFYSYTLPNNIVAGGTSLVTINIGALNHSTDSVIWKDVISLNAASQSSIKSLSLWSTSNNGNMVVFKNDVGVLTNRFLWRGTLIPPDTAIGSNISYLRASSYFIATFNMYNAARSMAGYNHLDRTATENTMASYGFHAMDFYNYQVGFMVAPYDAGGGQHWSIFDINQSNVFLGISTAWLDGTPSNASLVIAFHNAGSSTFTLGGGTKHIAVFD